MITRIQALRYRCFNQLDARWQQYTVLAGANGSGKSTLLDIPQLFSEILTRGVAAAFHDTSPVLGAPRARNPRELIHGWRGNDFALVLEAQLPRQLATELAIETPRQSATEERRWPHVTLRYEVRFEVTRPGAQVKEEFLWLLPINSRRLEKDFQIGGQQPANRQPFIRRAIGAFAEVRLVDSREEQKSSAEDLLLPTDPGPDRLLLSTIAELHPATHWLQHFLTRGVLSYAPDVQNMHAPCPPGVQFTRSMRNDALNLPWIVRKLQREKPEMFATWVGHVKTIVPNIVAIDTGVEEHSSSAYLRVAYHGGYAITSSSLSDGTLAILALTILPYLPNTPELLCLEEPGAGIHPRGIEAILHSLRSLYRSQVWVSTHSPLIVAQTEVKSLMFLRSDGNNAIEAISGNQHPRLHARQSSAELNSLFTAGALDP